MCRFVQFGEGTYDTLYNLHIAEWRTICRDFQVRQTSMIVVPKQMEEYVKSKMYRRKLPMRCHNVADDVSQISHGFRSLFAVSKASF